MQVSETITDILTNVVPPEVVKQVDTKIAAYQKLLPKDFNPVETFFTYGARILFAVGLMILGWVAARWLMERTHKALMRAHMADTPAQFLASALRFSIIFICFIIAVLLLGGSLQGLLALTGALVLALGLGLKDTLTNVSAGLMLLVNQPFQTGDYITIGTESGTVKRIGLFQTELNTVTNVRVFIPNRRIWDSPLLNFTFNRLRMVELKLRFDSQHTLEQVSAAIQDGLKGESRILPEPKPFIGVDAWVDNVTTYLVRVWVRTADWVPVNYTLPDRIKAATKAAGLDHPYPLMAKPLPESVTKKLGAKKAKAHEKEARDMRKRRLAREAFHQTKP